MVSLRCKMKVIEELKKLDIQYLSVNLGMVELIGEINSEELAIFKENLLESGLELMDSKKNILVERIKNTIIEMIHYSDDLPIVSYSVFLCRKLNHNYTYLANIFSEVTGYTIQNFIIAHKIEKVKELLVYNELSLTEISYVMGYSSVAHLSNQFKKVTGQSPSSFKSLKGQRNQNMENM